MIIVETGLLRFAVPDEGRDDSFHTFRRDAFESVSVDVARAPKVRPAAVISRRLADVESWADDLATRPTPHRRERAVEILGLRDSVVVTLAAPELDSLHQVYLAGILDSGDVVCLRHSRRSSDREADGIFERLLATARSGTGVEDTPAGWRARRAHCLAFALPDHFEAPRAFAFVAPEWRLTLSHGIEPAGWKAYFRSTDELETLDQQLHEAEVGPKGRRWTESTLRVKRRRPPVMAGSILLAAEVIDEHVIREAGLDDIGGRPLRMVAAARSRDQSSLDSSWRSLRSSLDEEQGK